MSRQYTVNEIFGSLQGEGVRAGTFNFFVRFSFCNLKCSDEPGPLSPGNFNCDTEFQSGRKMTAEEIFKFCEELNPKCRNVIFTGGEPALQLDQELLELFHDEDFYNCIETNGTKDLSLLWAKGDANGKLDWITLSPKVAEHAIKCLECDEIKYVRGYGQAIPEPTAEAEHKLISPAFDGTELDRKTLDWCIKLIKENPDWRLSVQQHKAWKVR